MKSPVGTRDRSSGANTMASAVFARKSIPALPAVSYCGNGNGDRLMIFTFKTGIFTAKVAYCRRNVATQYN
jgi:hypothetical protein